MRSLGGDLARLGGADPDVLKKVPSAQSRFVQMGLVLLSTAGLAVVSMSFALTDALYLHAWQAIPFAVAWGFVILNLDRLLIQHMDARASWLKTALMVAPRLVMAALLGIVISTPLVLRVFENDINAQLVAVNTQAAQDFNDGLQKTAQAVELEKVKQQISSDESVLAGSTPAVQTPALTNAKNNLTEADTAYQQKVKAVNDLYERMQCELYGSTCRAASGRNGAGPLYDALKKEYSQAVAQQSEAAAARTKAQQALARAQANADHDSTAAAAAAQAQASAALPGLRTKRDQLQAVVDAQRNKGSQEISGGTGLLSQLTALSTLSSRNWTAGLSHAAVALLFFMVELLPVTVKTLSLMGPKSLYERMRDLEEGTQLDEAKARRNDTRRKLEAETKKRRDVEDDMRARERDLGIKANAHVANQMESLLDVALLQWSKDVAHTLAQAAPSGPQPQPGGQQSGGQQSGGASGAGGSTVPAGGPVAPANATQPWASTPAGTPSGAGAGAGPHVPTNGAANGSSNGVPHSVPTSPSGSATTGQTTGNPAAGPSAQGVPGGQPAPGAAPTSPGTVDLTAQDAIRANYNLPDSGNL